MFVYAQCISFISIFIGLLRVRSGFFTNERDDEKRCTYDNTACCSCNNSFVLQSGKRGFRSCTHERFHDGILCKRCNGKQMGKYFKLCNEHQLIRAYAIRHYLRNVRTGLGFTNPVLALFLLLFSHNHSFNLS